MHPGSNALAARLDAEKSRIVELWELRARRSISAAAAPAAPVLVDDVPALLDEVVEALNEERHDATELERTVAARHGRERACLTDYSLEQVIREYGLLRQTVFEVLEVRGAPLSIDEREALLERLDIHVRVAAMEFVRVRDQDRKDAQQKLEELNGVLERRVVERTAELSESERRFRGLVEGVKDYAIFTIDPAGTIMSWNSGAERLNGYRAGEIVGRHFSVLYPEEGRQHDEPMAHLRVAEAEGRFRGEGLRIRKSGERYLADVLVTPMHDGAKLVGFSKVVQDLTERNSLLQERELLRSDAEKFRLHAEYREQVVAELSHDLRSPLSVARTGAQLIVKKSTDPLVLSLASRIDVAVLRADRLLVDLLDASRIDAGMGLKLVFDAADLCQIARDVSAELSVRHGERFVLHCESDARGVWNADALWRVLENLLANAVKYGEPATPITIGIRRRDDRVVLSVHNVGTSISPTEQAKLFEPYHRTPVAQSSGKTGWGLGLTLVRGIVEAHKGSVTVESTPTAGTTFTVELPSDARG